MAGFGPVDESSNLSRATIISEKKPKSSFSFCSNVWVTFCVRSLSNVGVLELSQLLGIENRTFGMTTGTRKQQLFQHGSEKWKRRNLLTVKDLVVQAKLPRLANILTHLGRLLIFDSS